MEYKSTIKSRPYLYKETKKAVSIINQGFCIDDIKKLSVDENIFQLESEARKREVASIIVSRLKVLDEYLLRKIVDSSIETSKILVLYSILKTDRLFFEFMNEIYKEKILLKDLYIRDKDFILFFQSKKEQSDRVASWSEITFKKLKQVYIRILFEAGLIENQKDDKKIKIPIIDLDVKEHIVKNGNEIYISSLGI